MNKEIISLDLETSGLDIEKGVTILSIGMVHLASGEEFYREAKHDMLVVEPRASRVHKLDMNYLDSPDKDLLQVIDIKASNWLLNLHDDEGKFIPLGWNVASFDMPFVRKFLPCTAHLFSYRAIDLNSMLFTEDVIKGRELLRSKEIYNKLFPNEQVHNALADARQAAKIFEQYVLTQQVRPVLAI